MATVRGSISADLGLSHYVCSEKLIFEIEAENENTASFSLQTYAPLPKLTPPVRSGKPSFSLQTEAPGRNPEPNGPRRRAKVASRCWEVKWGIVFAADRSSGATIQLEHSGLRFAFENHRSRCRRLLVGKIPKQTGPDVEQKLEIAVGG